MTLAPNHPAWRIESISAAEMIAEGATILGRADYSTKSRYNHAFFLLTIGFERAGKLAFMADHCISNNGNYPSNKELRKIGHNLESLFDYIIDIIMKYAPNNIDCKFPNTSIHKSIIEVLSRFSTSTRYYNLDYLTNAEKNGYHNPIAEWYTEVCIPIFDTHMNSRMQNRITNNAQIVHELSHHMMIPNHSTETGKALNNVYDASVATGESYIIKRWSRMYILQIARSISNLLDVLENLVVHKHGVQEACFFDEPFEIFRTEDRYFRERKTWAIYSWV